MIDVGQHLTVAPGALAGVAVGPDASAAVAIDGGPTVIVPTSGLDAIEALGVRWVWWSGHRC